MSGHEWKPGDVATHAGTGERVIRHAPARDDSRFVWTGVSRKDGLPFRATPDFGPLRPLVVIDPEDREQIDNICKALVEAMHRAGDVASAANGVYPATMAVALREFANPTPPRPEEPTGLGAVVEDKTGKRWVRIGDMGTDDWRQSGINGGYRGKWHRYDEITAVRVLSDGVQP